MQLDLTRARYLVVGAGFYGAVIAEHIARELGQPVVVIDKRDHTGGNCHSEIDPETGIEFHKYGTHIFHTRDERVWSYVQRFTTLNGYRHQVLAQYKDRVYQMPINLETINSFYDKDLKPFEVKEGHSVPLNLGGVIKAEFTYARSGDKVQMSPDKVWYYGPAGEEYQVWAPIGKSPTFTIRDKDSGNELARAFFPGTC